MKQTQDGRSMIEMLGVLAIIGILSIGGIAGYTMAMNRYKANVILDLANRLSMAILTRTPVINPTDKWNDSHQMAKIANEVYKEYKMSYDGRIGWSSEYETTFIVEENGAVILYGGKNGIRQALGSILGVNTATGPINIIEGEAK